MKFKFGKSLKNDYIFLLSLTFVIICIGLLIFYSIGPQAYRLIDIKYFYYCIPLYIFIIETWHDFTLFLC